MISHLSIVESDCIQPTVDIWHFTHIREDVVIGSYTTIGSHCYIDKGVQIGVRCKIQSGCLIYHTALISNEVFIGPGVMILNDRHPRACIDGCAVREDQWMCQSVNIGWGASIGAGSIIMPGITIGEHSVIGAGSLVNRDVEMGETVMGVVK